MAETYRFPCGCSFKCLGKSEGGLPLLDFNIEDVPESCPAVWDLLAKGRTVGIFQLEKSLGQDWSRKLGPESIDHLAALGALLRPGPLQGRNDKGVSMTETYCRRKNNLEPVDLPHESLRSILGDVYGVCVYQENLMRLSSDLAGFGPNEVEALRKRVSKKDMKQLMELKVSFLEGCRKTGIIGQDVAELIWSWIEAAGRYSFCLAHAAAYAILTYYSAWAKAHCPLYFFTAWLSGTRFKNSNRREEISILLEDARMFDVSIKCPRLASLESFFHTDGSSIYFGLADIKGVGEKTVEIIREKVAVAESQLGKSLKEFSWPELFLFLLSRLSCSVSNNLIRSGACDEWGVSREQALAEHNAWSALTASEKSWVHDACDLRLIGSSVFDVQSDIDCLLEERKSLEKGSEEFDTNKERLTLQRRFLKILQAGADSCTLDDCFHFLAEHCVKPAKKDEILGHLQVLRSVDRKDSPRSLVLSEEELLGAAVSVHRMDQVDMSEASCTIAEYLAGTSKKVLLGVEVTEVQIKVTVNGKTPGRKMAKCVMKDRTGAVKAVCFPEAYANCGHLLSQGSFLLVQGQMDKKFAPQLVIDCVWMPSRENVPDVAFEEANV